jgi:Rrf2 family protein
MVLLNRKMDYALLILCYLYHKKAGSCAREIADHYRISRPFVANILKELCQHGFVTSQRGVKGGYLAVPAMGGMPLAKLLDELEKPVRLAECNTKEPAECCDLVDSCPIRGPILEVNRRIREVLEGVTLAEIFAKHEIVTPETLLDVSRCAVGPSL